MGQADEARPVVVVRGLQRRDRASAGQRADPPAGRGPVSMIGRGTWRSPVASAARSSRSVSRACWPRDCSRVIANTGDDFEHLGLAISPDIDTLIYTLAGLADPVQGWGRRDETWTFMAALEQLGGETWFRLGDADLAMHVERTRRLAAGESLSAVTDRLRRRLGIAARILPMTDDPVRTRVRTDAGWLDFQDYFVRRRLCTAGPANSRSSVPAAPGRCPQVIAALGRSRTCAP